MHFLSETVSLASDLRITLPCCRDRERERERARGRATGSPIPSEGGVIECEGVWLGARPKSRMKSSIFHLLGLRLWSNSYTSLSLCFLSWDVKWGQWYWLCRWMVVKVTWNGFKDSLTTYRQVMVLIKSWFSFLTFVCWLWISSLLSNRKICLCSGGQDSIDHIYWTGAKDHRHTYPLHCAQGPRINLYGLLGVTSGWT